MWPLIMAFLRRNATFLTLPFAAVVGVIGYNIESRLSDRYTPYNKPVQDQRQERQLEDLLKDPTHVDKLKYKENVLGRNVSPSLENMPDHQIYHYPNNVTDEHQDPCSKNKKKN